MEGLMLKLKLQYFGYLMRRADSFEKTLMLGKVEGTRRRGQQTMRRQPTRLPRPWDSPGKNTGVGCHFLLQSMEVKSESEVAQWCPTLSDTMDCSLPGFPFSSHPQSLQASRSFPMSQLFASGSQSIGVSASTSVLPMNTLK